MSEQERPVDRPRTLSASADAIGTKTCATCGTPIEEYEWFPIRGRTDTDGAFQVYSFCDEECVEAWGGVGD